MEDFSTQHTEEQKDRTGGKQGRGERRENLTLNLNAL